MLQIFTTLVEDFSKKYSFTIKKEASENIITLYVKDFPIAIFYNNGFIILQSGVALIPENSETSFFRQLLIFNNGLIETNGAAFGFDPEQDMAILQFSCAIQHITEDEFEALVFNFIENLALWMKKLAQYDCSEKKLNKYSQYITYKNITIGN